MVTTVIGKIKASELGYTLPHEHILCDLRPLVDGYNEITRSNLFRQKVCMQNLGELSRNPYAVLDNAVLNEEDIQTNEVLMWKKAGGDSIADATTRDFGRDPAFLYGLSCMTGINIIAGCGNYIDAVHDSETRETSAEEIKKRIIRDLNEGMDETEIRSGMIGEIGTGMKMTESEKKCLKAASGAQAETGAGMHIHACLWNREGLNALDYAISNGADASKVCVDHADALLDTDYILGILDRGAYMEFDNFGKEYYVDRKFRNLLLGLFSSDKERVITIKKLIDRGYIRQLFVIREYV